MHIFIYSLYTIYFTLSVNPFPRNTLLVILTVPRFRQKVSPWKKMPTHARRIDMPLSPEVARRLGNGQTTPLSPEIGRRTSPGLQNTPLSPEIARRAACVSPLQATPLSAETTNRICNPPLQSTQSAKQAYLNLKVCFTREPQTYVLCYTPIIIGVYVLYIVNTKARRSWRRL